MNKDTRHNLSETAKLWRKIYLPLVILFAVIASVGDLVVSTKLTDEAELSNAYKVSKLEDPEIGQNEIPIFGASIARNAFYPDSLGENYYNYAMEHAGFIVNEVLIRMELAKDKKTPLILDFHFRGMEEDTTGASINIRTFLPFAAHNSDVRKMLHDYDRFRPHMTILGARYFGSYTGYMKDYLAEYYQPRKVYNRGGVFNKESPSQDQMDRLIALRREQGPNPFIYNKEIEARFESLIISRPDRLFLFIGSPKHRSVYEMLPNYDEMKAWAREFQAKHDNVRFVIFECDYPESYFKDTGHLSLEGAQDFSGQLRHHLEKLGLYFTGEEEASTWPKRGNDIVTISLTAKSD